MSMFSDAFKMDPILELNEQSNFKFKIGELVRHTVNTPTFGKCREKTGTIEAQRIKYARRYYDVKFSQDKNIKTVIETELEKF